MKKRLFSLSILLSLCGCAKELVYDTIIDEVPVVDNTFVNSNAIQKYAQASFPLSKSDSLEFKIEAITDFAGDTLMYVINFANGNGWKIISADTRTPSILAEGDYGSFSLNNASPSVNVWLDSVKRNMSLIRKSSDEALSFSVELIHSYKSFWNQFSSYALQKPMDPEENGDWFSHTDIEIIVDETVDHLVAK